MKIIRITDTDSPRHDIDFHPDSALLLPGRPLFYPDFGGNWTARPYLAIHINRLGKSISEKFAPRYYDSVAAALTFLPADSAAMLPGTLSGLDSSVTHGEWSSPDMLATVSRFRLSTIGSDTTDIDIPVNIPSTDIINRTVAQASTYTTLRMGDILLLPLGTQTFDIHPRTRIILTAPSATNPRELLNLKIV